MAHHATDVSIQLLREVGWLVWYLMALLY